MTRSYWLVGLALIALGIEISVLFFIAFHIIPIAALGIATIILGTVSLSIPEKVTASATMRGLMQGTIANAETILERAEVWNKNLRKLQPEQTLLLHQPASESSRDVLNRPVYLPPRNNRVAVYIPLKETDPTPNLDSMWACPNLIGSESLENPSGILIYPVGSEVSDAHEFYSGESAEQALRFMLVDSTQLCSSVAASEIGKVFVLEMKGVRLEQRNSIYSDALGSIPTSLAASVLATVQRRPFIILDERRIGDRIVARFRSL